MTPASSFYSAFKALDHKAMNAIYSEDVSFSDPAFGSLDSKRVRSMWEMLCTSQKNTDFRLTFEVLEESESKAVVLWEAFYTFSKTGRKVHNKVRAELVIKQGRIVQHIDTFNLYNWSKQALGLQGQAVGWTAYFKKKLQAQTNRLLDRWIDEQSAT